ncbi:hypothetical protein SAY87_023319 [Trapa incisa]|uniref:Terpene synthase metal-binding domain-containing protein n=1 Tax=Trapa incisa TaxID=236973 RepID=A0AAN7Q6B5_9MYRT|nr:hypothetical protein SAY87_023319 [Trapa incisa]
MKFQARAYFEEAKWFIEQKIPTMEEYLSIGLPSSACMLLTIISFFGMGKVANEHAFKWSFSSQNKIIKDLELIGRFSRSRKGSFPIIDESHSAEYGEMGLNMQDEKIFRV